MQAGIVMYTRPLASWKVTVIELLGREIRFITWFVIINERSHQRRRCVCESYACFLLPKYNARTYSVIIFNGVGTVMLDNVRLNKEGRRFLCVMLLLHERLHTLVIVHFYFKQF